MEKISALMDGELDAGDRKLQIQRLKEDPKLEECWATYHLIGDCLRNEGNLSANFARRLHDRLAQEPTVLNPRPALRISSPLVRYTLPIAAGVAGVSIVAWMGLSSPLFTSREAPSTVAQVVTSKPEGTAHTSAPIALRGNVSDYLTAHQEFSPRTAMQGVASYVRTVTDEQQIQDR